MNGEIPSSWASLVTAARPHRLLPVLAWYVRQHGIPVPPDIARVLTSAKYESTARSARAMEQLHEIGSEAQAPMMLVKGPVIATLYPQPWMRLYNDLDFLVPEESVPRVKKLLSRLGYRTSITGSRSSHMPPFYPPKAGLRVEIHTSLSRRESREFLTFAQVKNHTTPFREVPGISTLSPEAHFLYLCEHNAGRHLFNNGLLSLFDTHFFTAQWQDEWEKAKTLAEKWRLERHSGLTLALESILWNRSSLSETFPSPPPKVLEVAVEAISGTFPRVPSMWRDLPRNGVRGWISYAATVISGGKEVRMLPFRSRLRFHLLRPWHLIRAHGPVLLNLLTGRGKAGSSLQAQRVLVEWLAGGLQ